MSLENSTKKLDNVIEQNDKKSERMKMKAAPLCTTTTNTMR